jgi:hypothetical protein
MRPLENFDFSTLDTYTKSLAEIEYQIRELIVRIEECDTFFTDNDRTQLIANIEWIKRFYEAAERNLLNGNR